MRYCPACGTQYTDDTLRFCLQDGSTLAVTGEGTSKNVVLDETPTITRQRTPAAPTRSDVRYDTGDTLPKRRSMFVPFLLAGITGTVLFVAGAVATWIFLSGSGDEHRDNTANVNVRTSTSPANINVSVPTPNPRTSVTQSPTPLQSLPERDVEKARLEVSQVIEQWRADTEGLNLNSYMENYARTVDYYNRRGASRDDIRNDKARAFGTYDSIRMDISEMNLSIEGSGGAATAEFDKEWEFRGTRSSSGKVRSQLRLRREDGRWLIVGERDVRVYYVN